MAQQISCFDTAHCGPVHDACLDYYGKRCVTASSDHSIRMWDIAQEQPLLLAELRGHDAPVWQVAWAHPQFGSVLASCSYDRKILLWKESSLGRGDWRVVHKSEDHSASVNTVAFAPWEYGLQVAAGSSDGTISVLSHCADHTWHRKAFIAHPNGVNSVAWSPTSPSAADIGAQGQKRPAASTVPQRMASGGSDNMVRIWVLDNHSNEWIDVQNLGGDNVPGHSDFVRDIAWRPVVGLSSNTLASCSEDHTVIIWTQETSDSEWQAFQIIDIGEPVWKVSWSVTGTVLAVASGDRQVSLYNENMQGVWERLDLSATPGEGTEESQPQEAAGTLAEMTAKQQQQPSTSAGGGLSSNGGYIGSQPNLLDGQQTSATADASQVGTAGYSYHPQQHQQSLPNAPPLQHTQQQQGQAKAPQPLIHPQQTPPTLLQSPHFLPPAQQPLPFHPLPFQQQYSQSSAPLPPLQLPQSRMSSSLNSTEAQSPQQSLTYFQPPQLPQQNAIQTSTTRNAFSSSFPPHPPAMFSSNTNTPPTVPPPSALGISGGVHPTGAVKPPLGPTVGPAGYMPSQYPHPGRPYPHSFAS